MEVQDQRDTEKLGGPQCDIGVGEGPVGVDNIGPPLAAEAKALEKTADDVGDGEKLQPGLVCHLAGSTFFVGEHF